MEFPPRRSVRTTGGPISFKAIGPGRHLIMDLSLTLADSKISKKAIYQETSPGSQVLPGSVVQPAKVSYRVPNNRALTRS